MARELVFTVEGTHAEPAHEVSMSDVGLLERQHLQEWVLAHPELLGDDAMVVSFEFDRWTSAASGRTWDRLDVLAVDQTGRLIVAELKRDRAPDTVTMQAINYAAMVSRFSLDVLADVHAAHLGVGTTSDDALTALQGWAPEISDETLGPPRVVLLASDFGPAVTNTALFLYETGLDIRLIRYQLYRTTSAGLVLTVSQLLPVPEAEEFMVRPRSSTTTQNVTRVARDRRASIPQRLIKHSALSEGAPLTIVVPDGVGQDRETISTWLAADPVRARVTWHPDPQRPLEWAVDGNRYSFAGLITRVITDATGASPQANVWGPNWIRDNRNTPLHQMADALD